MLNTIYPNKHDIKLTRDTFNPQNNPHTHMDHPNNYKMRQKNTTLLCYYYSLVESHIDILCGEFWKDVVCSEGEEEKPAPAIYANKFLWDKTYKWER